ncbi:hypothetical protein PoB_001371200 [Plakobranchus ocellatus]|uniref:Uncharacterized protein n=1 Tax=Plakobranchus ocellatus TaxID=259542 RepID=A0AAV3YXZ3_9GAST|nr:hypothetical protein PoB_001371200 [Plakobranchus ocellatus]
MKCLDISKDQQQHSVQTDKTSENQGQIQNYRAMEIHASDADEGFRISHQPVKSLGRRNGSSLKDAKRGSEALEHASVDLQVTDMCGLPQQMPGKCKECSLQVILSQSSCGHFYHTRSAPQL